MQINFKNAAMLAIPAGIVIGLLGFVSCCGYPIDIVLLLAVGAGMVHLSKGAIKEQNDVLVNGAAAGGIAGVVGGILYGIVILINNIVFGSMISNMYKQYGISATPGVTSAITSAICCFPLFIFIGIVLGALGALAYTYIKK